MNPPIYIRELVFKHNWNELTPAEETELLDWRAASSEHEDYFRQETSAEQRRAVAEREEAARERNYRILMNRLEQLKTPQQIIEESFNNQWRRLAATLFIGMWILRVLTTDLSGGPIKLFDPKYPQISNLLNSHELHKGIEDIRNGWHDGAEAAREARKKRMNLPPVVAFSMTPGSSSDRHHVLTTNGHNRYLRLLPDGSRAWQNVNSSVAYPENYSAGTLKLRVSGEVYLEISPNKADRTPFFAEAGTVHIEAHTGRFNIRAYPGEPAITITAIESKLTIRCDSVPGSNPVVLSPGEQLIVRGNQTEIKKSVDIDEVLGWKREF
ncbi:MAG TPA: FecR domain-containing protein [Puia sp.]|nr:FecR domain-containing protein [Puia sp.]